MKREGQALLLILLVMAVALTIGVAVSSRAILTLRQITFSAQSVQALASAEAGLEDVLKCLNDGTCTAPYDPPAVDLNGDGSNDFDYVAKTVGGTDVFADLPPLARDKVAQVSLDGYPAATSVFVSWVKSNNQPEVDNPTALEISLIYLEEGTYKLARFAYDPDPIRRSANKFLAPGSLGYIVGGTTYSYQVSIAAPAAPKLLRLRALYSKIPSSFAVSAAAGNNLPSQGVEIESTGFSGQVIRKVKAVYTAPALSELFDFVIFSGSDTKPLQK